MTDNNQIDSSIDLSTVESDKSDQVEDKPIDSTEDSTEERPKIVVDTSVDNEIGILDPEGVKLNPLTGEEYSDTYKEIAKKWSKFPAYEKAQEVIDQIKANRVILVTSGTGSGKTVLVPKFCLHALNYDAKIAITLPKQLITKSAAEFAATTLDVKLGDDVGYQYRGSDRRHRSDKNKLLYATDGTIKARLLSDPLLKDFDAVIMDEAHERKVQIDFLLYLLRNVVKERPEFKLIIMSATINVDIFKKYYSAYNFVHINIGGKTNYPITSIFSPKKISERDYLEKGIDIINKLSASEEGDILFFVTSINETIDVCEKLEELKDDYCIEVYSGIDKERTKLAEDKEYYREITGKNRKIVIATNVAESSLTIDGIKFVIDSGLELSSYYDPKIRSKVLVKKLITHAQAKQRMGRAGRTGPGVCYHLYTKQDFDKNMDRFPKPNIRKSNLYDEVLRLLALEKIETVDDVKKMLDDFIEPPTHKYINESVKQLEEMTLVADGRLTRLGKIIVDMRDDPMEAMSIYAAHHLNCAKEVIAVISMMNACKGTLNELFNLPMNNMDEEEDAKQIKYLEGKFKTAKEAFNTRYGDHLTLLKMFNMYLKKKKDEEQLKDWVYKFFLKRSTFDKAKRAHRRYYSMYRRFQMEKIKIEGLMEIDIAYRVLAALMFGYRTNMGTASKGKIKTSRVDNVDVNKHSFLDSSTKTKKDILYYELFTSAKTSINIVSSIPDKAKELYDKFLQLDK